MKQIALSIQQMNHLQGLGVDTSNASMCWINGEVLVLWDKTVQQTFYNANVSFENDNKYEPAFTLQDILELLPNFISKDGYIYDLTSDMHNSMAYKRDWDSIEDDELLDEGDFYLHIESDGSNLLKMAFKMLCWCAENGYLKHKEEQ